jgi:hypothetical protein
MLILDSKIQGKIKQQLWFSVFRITFKKKKSVRTLFFLLLNKIIYFFNLARYAFTPVVSIFPCIDHEKSNNN